MADEPTPAPRGDAAWRAQKAEIAKRNEAAHKRGAEKRAEDGRAAAASRDRAERREDADLPDQPQP